MHACDGDGEGKELGIKMNIKGFPTIIAIHKKKLIPYEGDRLEKDITRFMSKLG